MTKIIIVFSLAVLMFQSSYSQHKKSMEENNLSELYKSIKTYKEQPEYWIFIHSNNCSYVATINDMPIYTDFNDGSMKSLSFPLNPLLLSNGSYGLKITLLPKQDSEFNLASKIEKNSSVQVKISRTLNKVENVVLDETFSVKEDSQVHLEKIYEFKVDVPYTLVGWSKSADLKKEDKSQLLKDVVGFYQNMMHLYKKKDIAAISTSYHLRQLEIAQALYSSKKEDSEKLAAKLNKDIHLVQDFKLENYKLQFYANGQVVGLVRTDGEFLGKPAFLGLTEQNFYIYPLLLHRPKPGAPLAVIR